MQNSIKHVSSEQASQVMKSLRRGILIEKGFHINLENVCSWSSHPEYIQFQMTDQNIINVYVKDSDSSKYTSDSIIEINEFKRIQRELAEYMSL